MFPLALRVPLAPRNSCAGTDGSAPPWQLRTCGRPDSLDLFVYPPRLVATECRRMFSEGPADWSAIVVVGNEERAEHLDSEARCGAVYWLRATAAATAASSPQQRPSARLRRRSTHPGSELASPSRGRAMVDPFGQPGGWGDWPAAVATATETTLCCAAFSPRCFIIQK
ncbi:hypothetical protein ISCGN_033037, partial [Ixodes scapularis]